MRARVRSLVPGVVLQGVGLGEVGWGWMRRGGVGVMGWDGVGRDTIVHLASVGECSYDQRRNGIDTSAVWWMSGVLTHHRESSVLQRAHVRTRH